MSGKATGQRLDAAGKHRPDRPRKARSFGHSSAETAGVRPADRRSSDLAVIELLRRENPLGIADLAAAMGVTATAVRQRLDRLMADGLVARSLIGPADESRRRGRPSHRYVLTEKGFRSGGDNFRDLAMVLWGEVRSVKDPGVRQGLISRIGSALAGLYADRISGATPRQRVESVADLFRDRRLSFDVTPPAGDSADGPSVLTARSCPYPELAERDRGVCAAERLMLQDLVGGSVRLSECRLDGASCCRFTLDPVPAPGSVAEGSVGAEGPLGARPVESHAMTGNRAT